MALNYFKRFRMEIGLTGRAFRAPALPPGFELLGWSEELVEHHAYVKYHSFRDEIDAEVFPCLGDHDGCSRLMSDIAAREGFVPGATWLLNWQGDRTEPAEYCGTIQGIRDRSGYGAVQNVGVIPEHRGQGLGETLIVRALAGFQQAGLRRAFLEVTAQNKSAIRLYKRLGFARVRTVYKAVERDSRVVRV